MRTVKYSHAGGDAIVPPAFVDELLSIIKECDMRLGKYQIAVFKKHFLAEIHKKGWSDQYSLNRSSKITITSVKGKTGLCIQTGNMSRMYADLLKLQASYSQKIIDSGILILPVGACAKLVGDNIASYDRMIREMPIFDRVITMPLVIIGFDND